MEHIPSKELMSEEKSLTKVEATQEEDKGRIITEQDLLPIDKSDPDFPSNTNLPSVRLEKELPLNVLPERRQASLLGWNVGTLRTVNELTGIFLQLPTICGGTQGCPYGSICWVSNRDQFIGKSCPLEVLEIYKHFSGYVKDLNITSKDYTDLQLVADLVRQHLILWRSDMHMKLQSELVKEVKVVNQKTGQTHDQLIVNPHRTNQTAARAAIHTIYKQLQASRADKSNKVNDQLNAASIMQKLLKNSN